MALRVCPLSDLKLCVGENMHGHAFRRRFDAGLNACVNADDPAYFGGYVNDNFAALNTALDLTDAEVRKLVQNGIESAFTSAQRRAELTSMLEQ